jgi:hypothetical protein
MKKLPIDYLGAFGTTVGDVYFPQTELLLPFDGANGATTTSDLSDNNHPVTFAGNAQILTAQSKFGGSSCYFDGTGDYLTMPSNAAFAFAGDFTVECWVRRTATGNYPYLWDFRAGGAQAEQSSVYLNHADSYKPHYYVDGAVRINSTAGLAVDTWYHFAIVRSSGTTTMYVDGSSAGSFSDSFTYPAGPLRIGDYSNNGYGLTGYVDDFRITNGIARYTSSFTPPTTAHLTSAGDVNKQIIVNSAADGVAIGTGGINQARIAKAWVNFDGTGTIAIRESYNVSSLTDHATGDYTVTFSTAMTDANYVMAGSALNSTYSYSGDDSHRLPMPQKDGYLASSIRVFTKYGHSTGEGQEDENIVNVIIFGN